MIALGVGSYYLIGFSSFFNQRDMPGSQFKIKHVARLLYLRM